MATFSRGVEQEPVRTGGGGPGRISGDRGYGGGGNNENPGRRIGRHERLRRYRLGLAVGLISVVMLFVGLTSAYIVRQGSTTLDLTTGEYKQDWKPIALPGLLWLNTVILLASSATMEMARRSILRADIPAYVGPDSIRTERPRLPWLGITVVLGAGFLAGQVMAWQELTRRGIYLSSNPSSSFFYMLTGAHAVHLSLGLVALLFAGLASLMHRSLESRQIAVDVTSWYWHFMGVLWVYILALMYLVR